MPATSRNSIDLFTLFYVPFYDISNNINILLSLSPWKNFKAKKSYRLHSFIHLLNIYDKISSQQLNDHKKLVNFSFLKIKA